MLPFRKRLISIASMLTVALLLLLFGPVSFDAGWAPSAIRFRGTTWKPTSFHPGIVKPHPATYSKMVVLARTRNEDVDWVEAKFKNNSSIESMIYTADDPTAEHHPPENKGHEVMIYLSHIIENYNNLSDVNIFMHSHRIAWHNNRLLNLDAAEMISKLSSEHVIREGYMNLRCDWSPGCPDWMHPGAVEEDSTRKEQSVMARAWAELFPLEPVPSVLAQSCCSQFAVSRERIRAIPLARYMFYRDWLSKTELSDSISGRVWEYLWQFVFSGQAILCPKVQVCYCEGYGICFGRES